MWSQMTIVKKLLLSSGAAAMITLVVGGVALYSLGAIGSSMKRVTEFHARKQLLAAEIENAASEAMSLQRGMQLRTMLDDTATAAGYQQELNTVLSELRSNIDAFRPLIETSEGRTIIETLDTSRETIERDVAECNRLVQSAQVDKALDYFLKTSVPHLKDLNKAAGDLVHRQNQLMSAAGKEAESTVSRSQWAVGILLIAAMVIGSLTGLVSLHISRDLRKAIADLAHGSQQTAHAASQVSSASQSLAQGASEQAASLEETSASAEEINSMVRRNGDNSRTAAELVTKSAQQVASANEALEHTVTAMSEINAQSAKISRIIKVIDEIAFQTNILALNAAVEAARAGEAGQGFSVVADEVRSLAQRCAQAAKDTEALIQESVAKATAGQSKVDEVAAAIEQITAQSTEVKVLVDEVHAGSDEQIRGVSEISKAIQQMEQVTQRNAASAEESASAAEELNGQAELVRNVVHQLSAMVGGGEPGSR